MQVHIYEREMWINYSQEIISCLFFILQIYFVPILFFDSSNLSLNIIKNMLFRKCYAISRIYVRYLPLWLSESTFILNYLSAHVSFGSNKRIIQMNIASNGE